MEFLLFIALVVIIILLIKLRSNQKEIAERTHQSFLSLKKELIQIKEAGSSIKKEAPLQPSISATVPFTAITYFCGYYFTYSFRW